MHKGGLSRGSIVTNARGSSYSSQHQWGIAAVSIGQMEKAAYNESGDYFKKVGELAKIWAWDGRQIGKAS